MYARGWYPNFILDYSIISRYSASVLNRIRAIDPKTTMNPTSTSMFGTTELKSPPKINNLLKAVVAQA